MVQWLCCLRVKNTVSLVSLLLTNAVSTLINNLTIQTGLLDATRLFLVVPTSYSWIDYDVEFQS